MNTLSKINEDSQRGVSKNRKPLVITFADDMNKIIDKTNEIISVIPGSGKGTITQITSISTGVTINKASGVITTVSLTTTTNTVAGSFTITNSFAKSGSVILLTVEYPYTSTGFPGVKLSSTTNGSFTVTVKNTASSGSLNNVVKIHFVIL